MSGDVVPFRRFYRAVNGRDPLPWQERLAERAVSNGWPSEIGVPTGLGKTATIDIAVWALAATASAPTRIWYVVNRRLLVDAAWEHGCRIAALLRGEPHDDAIASVAAGLRARSALATDAGPLHVTRLRGGAELGARAPHPSQPAIVFATVPMFASRWLFRGYGTSSAMAPIDAAHAGIDSLVLLDEAHLARPLLRLAQHVAECDPGDPRAVLAGSRARPVFVALTATGEASGDRFDLDADDRAHPIVAQRLDAPKRGRLVETTSASLPKDMADAALAAVDATTASVVVFANTPRTAREVAAAADALARRGGQNVEIVVATGRARDREADRVRGRLLSRDGGVRAGHERRADRALVVVATQTLEVGADVDFDHLVTETAGARALVQRLGRVNRLGLRRDASCVICHPRDRQRWPVYGTEPQTVWDALSGVGTDGIDLSPGSVADVIGVPLDEPGRVGELLPAHLWEWAKTTTPPPGEAPVELFFDGFDAGGDVSVVWRAYRPAPGVRLIPGVSAGESVEIPVLDVRDALGEREVCRLGPDRVSLEVVPADAIRPGDTIVLAPADGLYDEFGWNPSAADEVLDVSLLHSGALPLVDDVVDHLAPGCLPEVGPLLKALREPADDDDVDERSVVAELVEALRHCAPHPWLDPGEWTSFLDGLGSVVVRPVDGVAMIAPAPVDRRWAAVGVRAEAFEELSFTAASPVLADHLAAVGDTAASIATALGLPAALVEAVRLAGRWHDLGKADARFQRWLDPDAAATAPLAKSGLARDRIEAARVASGWPKGGRHELLSVRLAASWLDGASLGDEIDRDLVLHLVASHHGHGRPLVRVVDDPAPTLAAAEIEGRAVAVSGDLSTADWDQPGRFRAVCERYGLWGVALLEAVLRQADHAVSQVSGVA